MIAIRDEVRAALDAGGAVVALESTIVAHGLPWPENLEIGRALEAEVRRGGAIPATIAVVDGVARVGLDDDALARVARDGATFRKAAAADLAVVVARGASAATTVSATASLAARVGIRVFATGGIGGVHRGDAADVSSDLTVLAREPIAVVSAGAKAILDLPRTVEMLETLGVLVVGWRCDELPAFYTRSSGIPLEHRIDHLDDLTAILDARWRKLHQGGVLICNPIPESAALPSTLIDSAITSALARASSLGHRGKSLTPFLLHHLAAATAGSSIQSNRALALNNASLAAEIARSLSRLGGA